LVDEVEYPSLTDEGPLLQSFVLVPSRYFDTLQTHVQELYSNVEGSINREAELDMVPNDKASNRRSRDLSSCIQTQHHVLPALKEIAPLKLS